MLTAALSRYESYSNTNFTYISEESGIALGETQLWPSCLNYVDIGTFQGHLI